MSAVLGFRARPTGAHRRTSASWQHLTDALAAAVTAAADTARQLADERTQRGHADALMGQLVQQRDEATARATAAEELLAVEQQRRAQAAAVIRDLRQRLDRPHGASDTMEMPMPLVMPLWESSAARAAESAVPAARAAESAVPAGRPSWATAS